MIVVVDLGGMRVGKRQGLVFDSEFLTNNDGNGGGGGGGDDDDDDDDDDGGGGGGGGDLDSTLQCRLDAVIATLRDEKYMSPVFKPLCRGGKVQVEHKRNSWRGEGSGEKFSTRYQGGCRQLTKNATAKWTAVLRASSMHLIQHRRSRYMGGW